MAAAASANIYALLNNDEQHSKAPAAKEGPGKPDKSDQRRSVPKARGGASTVAGGDANSAPRQQRERVDDRDRRGGRGGQTQRGGRGGGRGGYHGGDSDGVHRNFDRKQGEHTKHAPGEARKHGAVGEVDPTHFSGSTSEFAAQDAANTADANGDIIGDEILDITPMPTDPDDSKLSYDEYLASKNRPEDDLNRQTREVTNDGDFKAAKPIAKQEVGLFGEILSPTSEAERAAGGAKAKAKKKISLDEFVGERPTPAASSSDRGGRGGGRGGFDGSRGGRGGASSERGGRGGFDGASRGGRGGFDGARGGRGGGEGGRGGRGGRGGFDGARGGRGGQARAPAANVNLADQSAFPALSPK
jgi:hypothetical protein